ncbi:MAG: hypothetical protein ACM3WQ_00755 [Chloroflexota bacterium]
MAKIQFSKLKLNKETEVSKVTIGGVEIEVKHYIPMTEKLLVLDTIIQNAFDYNFINKAKADALLHMYMVMCYTNLNFTKKERDNMLDTYDLMEKNGVIDAVVSAIPENEYNAFVAYCEEVMGDYDKYKNSIIGVAEQILGELPDKLKNINQLMTNFNPKDLEVLQKLVNDVGGSPSAVTNTILGQN